MDRNILDADTVKLEGLHCGNGLHGRDSGVCSGCGRPAATLVSGHCTDCLTPCDIFDESGTCGRPTTTTQQR